MLSTQQHPCLQIDELWYLLVQNKISESTGTFGGSQDEKEKAEVGNDEEDLYRESQDQEHSVVGLLFLDTFANDFDQDLEGEVAALDKEDEANAGQVRTERHLLRYQVKLGLTDHPRNLPYEGDLEEKETASDKGFACAANPAVIEVFVHYLAHLVRAKDGAQQECHADPEIDDLLVFGGGHVKDFAHLLLSRQVLKRKYEQTCPLENELENIEYSAQYSLVFIELSILTFRQIVDGEDGREKERDDQRDKDGDVGHRSCPVLRLTDVYEGSRCNDEHSEG